MKIRFIIVLLGILVPATSFAGFPSFDPMNFGVNISENVQTVLSKVENSQQVVTMQKTLAKIGSAKDSISSFINKQKDVINKVKEKAAKYKEAVSGYVEKAKVYAEKAKDAVEKAKDTVNKAKDIVDQAKDIQERGLGDHLKESVGNAVGNLADKVGIDSEKVQGLTNKIANGKAADTTEGADTNTAAGDSAEPVANDKLISIPDALPRRQAIGGLAEKEVSTVTVEDTDKKENDPVNEKTLNKVQDVISADVKNEVKKIDVKIDAGSVEPVKGLNTITPKRVQFKSSYGYGKMQTKHQLSYASLGGNSKTGSTAEGILVVPESISLNCALNYEDATKDGKMDECLKKINTIAVSEVTEDVTQGMIEENEKDVYNGYVEYLTATYFDALDTYNESLTFKSNELDPIMTTSTSDIDASWRIAKEMHIVLGDRVNKLRQLWSRVLSMKMYSIYTRERFANKEE